MIKQEIDQPETIAKACEENENADHQIKASNMESVITNEISAEGNKTPRAVENQEMMWMKRINV